MNIKRNDLFMNSMYKSCLFCVSDYAKKENRLLMYIGDFNKQLDYLYKLIKIINVQNLTQVKKKYIAVLLK